MPSCSSRWAWTPTASPNHHVTPRSLHARERAAREGWPFFVGVQVFPPRGWVTPTSSLPHQPSPLSAPHHLGATRRLSPTPHSSSFDPVLHHRSPSRTTPRLPRVSTRGLERSFSFSPVPHASISECRVTESGSDLPISVRLLKQTAASETVLCPAFSPWKRWVQARIANPATFFRDSKQAVGNMDLTRK